MNPPETASKYIHGTNTDEQSRLSLLNSITNASFLDFMDIKNGESVLEVGSGIGILANSVATRNPDSGVFGIEISPDQIKKAFKNYSETPNVTFIQGDASSITFDNDTFDVIYCRYILEHVSKPESVLREIYRVLKPGGKLFVQENNVLIYTLDPDCPSYSFILKKFAEVQSILGGDAEIGKKLFGLIKKAGFSSIELSIAPEVHYYGLPTYVPWIENSIEIIKGAKKHLLELHGVDNTLIDEAINELDNLKSNPYGSAYFYWNRASALKP
jgi:2-polyprenyl-3-methyl-5-hydroxy-6-metoxy-1,4-benzoquinol methylase